MKAALPDNEDFRLQALHQLSIMDTAREKSYDDIAQLAMMICNLPIAVVTLIDENRQWFKTCVGLEATETHRDVAFCAHAILNPTEILEVEDATQDERFSDNPLVTSTPGIRFYAGAPLVMQSGVALGTLCVVDYKPGKLTESQKKSLTLLAGQIVKLFELQESHQKLSDQSQKLSSFYLMSPVAIALNRFDDGVFLEANPELYRMLGYTPEEFCGLSYWDITPKKYEADEVVQLQQLRQYHRYGPYEKHFINKAGDWVPVLLNGVLIKSLSGELQIWSIIQDISERKRVEQLKNEFVSSVSHELRTPLTSISAALRMVLGGAMGEVSEKMGDLLKLAVKNSQRLTLLINDLLDMEKLLAGKMVFDMQPDSVISILEQSILENQAYADQYGINFYLVADSDCKILIDGHRLQQVLNNFLSNAAKFSNKNSKVEVKLDVYQDHARISVQDYGLGIPVDFQKRIFQKFAQADASDARRRGGTGLGLSISKELIEHMGGTIGFTSELNQGSIFFVEFPLIVNDQESADV